MHFPGKRFRGGVFKRFVASVKPGQRYVGAAFSTRARTIEEEGGKASQRALFPSLFPKFGSVKSNESEYNNV